MGVTWNLRAYSVQLGKKEKKKRKKRKGSRLSHWGKADAHFSSRLPGCGGADIFDWYCVYVARY